MKASWRIALAYFSFVGLQTWLNWMFGVLLGLGLVLELWAHSSRALGGAMVLATLGAILLVAIPVFAGGLVLRAASSMVTLHLRPHGRRDMLAGATLAITLAAAVFALPLFMTQFSDARLPARATDFASPAISTFQIAWGGAALNWIMVFAMSRYQTLASLSFIVSVIVVNIVVRMGARMPLTADQLATGVFLAGFAGWSVFALWYMRTPFVERPGWISGWASGQAAPELERLTLWRGPRWLPFGGSRISRPVAVHHHLLGTDSVWSHVLMGAFMVAFLVPVVHILTLKGTKVPEPSILVLTSVIGGILAGQTVRRSRMLWLRTGLDRAGLFATAERHIWRATVAMFIVPGFLAIALPLALRTHQYVNVLLFVILQLTFAGCFLYGGLALTRGWNAAAIAVMTILVVILSVLTGFMAPREQAFTAAYPAAIAASGALAFIIRIFARRTWLALDWRLTGPPLPRLGIRGT